MTNKPITNRPNNKPYPTNLGLLEVFDVPHVRIPLDWGMQITVFILAPTRVSGVVVRVVLIVSRSLVSLPSLYYASRKSDNTPQEEVGRLFSGGASGGAAGPCNQAYPQ